jgi:hypothetical protein
MRSKLADRSARLACLALTSLLLPWGLTTSAAPKAPSSARSNHGFAYQHDEVAEVPWSMHIVKIDRPMVDLELHTAMGRGTTYGLSTLTEQLKLLPSSLGRPVAAINGDFYLKKQPYVGDPEGLQIARGEIVSGPSDRKCFWIDTDGNPQMGNVLPFFRVTWPNRETTLFGINEARPVDGAVLYTPTLTGSTGTSSGREYVLEKLGSGEWLPLRPGMTYSGRVREIRDGGNTAIAPDTMVLSVGPRLSSKLPKVEPGAILQLSTATSPDLKGVETAIGGGPALVHEGKVLDVQTVKGRHPRSAVGWNKTHIFLVEVDGRQMGLSVGMTLPELAKYMAKIGCEEALNLDGGASATLWVYGQVMNSPSLGRERDMANSLILIQKDKK